MSGNDFDPSQLNESQQLALGTYTSVTNQEPSAAIPLLQRSEWNVQVRSPQLRDKSSLECFTDSVHRLRSPNSLTAKSQIQSQKLTRNYSPQLLHLSQHGAKRC